MDSVYLIKRLSAGERVQIVSDHFGFWLNSCSSLLVKKLDRLIVSTFLSTLALTFCVVTFILLNRQLLFYYDDIIGKNLGWIVVGKFTGYFALFIIPQALPLAVLLASLISFGSMAEHFELTAIKASGVSLLRIIRPVFIVTMMVAGLAFLINNYVVPRAALNAFSLLYDIRQTKPALDIREGIFYNGLPGISLKVHTKFPQDEAALRGVILYDHRKFDRNLNVYVADSGRMNTLFDEQFLQFQLFNGVNYQDDSTDVSEGPRTPLDQMTRMKFSRMEILVDLSSFDLKSTDVSNFASHRYMKGVRALSKDIKRMEWEQSTHHLAREMSRPLEFMLSPLPRLDFPASNSKGCTREDISAALIRVRQTKAELENFNAYSANAIKELNGVRVQRHRIFTYAFACMAMFVIGAPLGAIIRKGGLGVPVLIAIVFFIVFLVFDMQGEKLSNRSLLPAAVGLWAGNVLMVGLGLFFLRVAAIDGRLFEADYYHIWFERLKGIFNRQTSKS